MKKLFVLDTNVLIHDPESIYKFEENDIYIPIFVIEEIDKFKRESTERGRNSRHFCRILDELRTKSKHPLSGGVSLGERAGIKLGKLYIYVPENHDYNTSLEHGSQDRAIMNCAIQIRNANERKKTVFITMDTNLRLRADAIGMPSETYESSRIHDADKTSSVFEVDTDKETIDSLFRDGETKIESREDLYLNCSVHLKNISNPKHAALGRYTGDGKVKKLNYPKDGVMGIRPKNLEQSFALDLLLDDNIQLVNLLGIAGSGKTLLAIAAGLSRIEEGRFSKMLVSRPVVPLGKDIGFLPGSVEEKLAPWMQPIFDNLEFLFSQGKKFDKEAYDELINNGIVQVEPLTYIRGRSLPYQYIVVDECLIGKTLIATENGKMSMRSIFNRLSTGRSVPRVRSYNEQTKEFEFNRVTSTRCNGEKPTIIVRLANRKVVCTKNHPFLTENRGWVFAGDLVPGDLVLSTPENVENSIQSINEPHMRSIIFGSFLGDGNLQNAGVGRKRLIMRHGMKQEDYCKWKISKIGGSSKIQEKNGFSQKPACVSTSFVFGSDIDFPSNKSNCTPKIIKDMYGEFDAKALAVWFMDDGSRCKKPGGQSTGCTIHTQSFSNEVNEELLILLSKFGLKAKINYAKSRPYIRLNTEDFKRLSEIIAPFVHKSMAYKLYEEHTHIAGKYSWVFDHPSHRLHAVDSITDGGNRYVYDIGVENVHNFVVVSRGRGSKLNRDYDLSGVVVHNCQNLTQHEIKTIMTRAGEGSKIVLTGDPEQIDNPYVDASSNGLSIVMNKFRNQSIAGSVVLTKGERSHLAELSARLL